MDKDHSKKKFPGRVFKGVFKLSNVVYAVSSKFLMHVYFLKTYSFILVRKKPLGIMVFDTGGPGSGELIINAVKKLGFSPKDIKAIAISHWHKDHTGGLAELIKKVQPDEPVKVYIGEEDFPLLSKRLVRLIWYHPILHFPIPHQSGKMPGIDKAEFIKLDSSKKEKLLKDWGVEYISTPGHTPGHTTYLHKESGALFPGCGLSIMPGNVVCIVPIFWRRKKMIESARRLSQLDFKYLHPVHFLLEANEIPMKNRVPVNGPYSRLLKFFGFYPLFRYKL